MRKFIVNIAKTAYRKFMHSHIIKSIGHKYYKTFMMFSTSYSELEIKSSDKCICLSPHQDDETIGMGGTLAKYHKNFDVICLTDGSLGITGMAPEKVTSIRNIEFQNAMKKAQIEKFYNMGAKDGSLIKGYNLFKNINLSQYKYIFIPNPIDCHKDHKAACSLLFKYLKDNPSLNPKIAFYEVWTALGYINYFVNISDFIQTKEEMINGYVTQCKIREFNYGCIGLAKYRGMVVDKSYAETFYIMDKQEFLQLINDTYKYAQ